MEQSQELSELAAALVKVQAVVEGAKKDSANPFFKSKYADLESVWEVCRKPLTDNGLAVVQTTDQAEQGVAVVTTLLHTSGQWMRGRLCMRPVKDDPQGVGSCITYARRYALAAIVGIYQTDDDGEGASGRGEKSAGPSSIREPQRKSESRPPAPLALTGEDDPLISDGERRKLFALLNEHGVSTDAFKAFCAEHWQIQSRAELRRSMLKDCGHWIRNHTKEQVA